MLGIVHFIFLTNVELTVSIIIVENILVFGTGNLAGLNRRDHKNFIAVGSWFKHIKISNAYFNTLKLKVFTYFFKDELNILLFNVSTRIS